MYYSNRNLCKLAAQARTVFFVHQLLARSTDLYRQQQRCIQALFGGSAEGVLTVYLVFNNY